jgi:hypothetical protein
MSGRIFEPNYSQVPNALLDGMATLSDVELRVALVVCRQTFGWHRERAILSISFLMKATGMAKMSVIKGCALLMGRGWLKKGRSGRFNGANVFELVVSDLSTGWTGKAPDLSTGWTGTCPRGGQAPVHGVDTNKERKERKETCSTLSNKGVATKSIKAGRGLTGEQKELADAVEALLGREWVNDAGKWMGRIRLAPDKCRRVFAEVTDANKNGRMRTGPARYAEFTWREFR